jgi:hypothetical protein
MRRLVVLVLALLGSVVATATGAPAVIIDVSSTNSGQGAVSGRQWSVVLSNLAGDTTIEEPIDSIDPTVLDAAPTTPVTCTKDALATCAGTMTYYDGASYLTGPIVFPAATGCPPDIATHVQVGPAPVGFSSQAIATAILRSGSGGRQPLCVDVRFSTSQTALRVQVPTGDAQLGPTQAFTLNVHDWAASAGHGSLFTSNPYTAIERTVSASVDGATPTTSTVTESVGGLTTILVAPYAHRVVYGSTVRLYATVYRAQGTSAGDAARLIDYADPSSALVLPNSAIWHGILTNAWGVVTLESAPLTTRTTLQVASALADQTSLVGSTVTSAPIGPIEVVAAAPTIRGLKVKARRGGRYDVTFSTTVAAGLTVTARAAPSGLVRKVSAGRALTFAFRNVKIRKGARLVVTASATGVTPGSTRRVLR